MTGRTANPAGLPTGLLLEFTEHGRGRAGWVFGADADGIGTVGEYGRTA
jgi:hypothetical protein